MGITETIGITILFTTFAYIIVSLFGYIFLLKRQQGSSEITSLKITKDSDIAKETATKTETETETETNAKGGAVIPNATDCSGHVCSIEGQLCKASATGSANKNWICKNRKWQAD
jgi:hypothetical protein